MGKVIASITTSVTVTSPVLTTVLSMAWAGAASACITG